MTCGGLPASPSACCGLRGTGALLSPGECWLLSFQLTGKCLAGHAHGHFLLSQVSLTFLKCHLFCNS